MCLFALQLLSMLPCSLVAKGFCIPCHSACIASLAEHATHWAVHAFVFSQSLSCELLCLCIADPDLAARIAFLEEQRQLDDGLARKLYDQVFRYSESKISKSTNRRLEGCLKAAYRKTVQGKLAVVHK